MRMRGPCKKTFTVKTLFFVADALSKVHQCRFVRPVKVLMIRDRRAVSHALRALIPNARTPLIMTLVKIPLQV